MWVMITGHEGAKPMMPCEQVLENLFDYLDGEIDDARAHQIQEHLEICKKCYPRARFEKAFLEAVHQVRAGEPAPPGVRDSVLAAIRGADSS